MSRRNSVKFIKRYSIYLRDDFKCAFCKEFDYPAFLKQGHKTLPLDFKLPDKMPQKQVAGGVYIKTRLTIDHLKAVSLGGKNNYLNLVTACSKCNLVKGCKPFKELLPQKQEQVLQLTTKEIAPYRRFITGLYNLHQNKFKALAALNKLIRAWQRRNPEAPFMEHHAQVEWVIPKI